MIILDVILDLDRTFCFNVRTQYDYDVNIYNENIINWLSRMQVKSNIDLRVHLVTCNTSPIHIDVSIQYLERMVNARLPKGFFCCRKLFSVTRQPVLTTLKTEVLADIIDPPPSEPAFFKKAACCFRASGCMRSNVARRVLVLDDQAADVYGLQTQFSPQYFEHNQWNQYSEESSSEKAAELRRLKQACSFNLDRCSKYLLRGVVTTKRGGVYDIMMVQVPVGGDLNKLTSLFSISQYQSLLQFGGPVDQYSCNRQAENGPSSADHEVRDPLNPVDYGLARV